MRATIEASLVGTLSVVLTLLILAAIFPRHALGGGASNSRSDAIQHAVVVHDTAIVTERAEVSACPYLAAIAAAPRCPAVPKDGAAAACPFLEEMNRMMRKTHAPPVRNLGQHT